MEPTAGCLDIGSLTSTLPVIPQNKLTDLYYLSGGGFGTVFKGKHSDWRTTVAVKCLKLDSPVIERERNCLLKEAEVLHKARFNYIIQIFGVCNEPRIFCIVTEFMSNGSLDRLLHEKDVYPVLAWPLRLRILYEIALGVNFLHNMNPPLVHHDLKTQNILLDGEFHVKIADFGLSKWRQLSVSRGSGSKPAEGTVIYMPPEEYEPSKSRRADVKHDMYSYAIIMWEVLSRQIPFKGAHKNKSSRILRSQCCSAPAACQKGSEEETPSMPKDRPSQWTEATTSGSGSCSSQDTDISLPGPLSSSNAASAKPVDCLPSSFMPHSLESPQSLKDVYDKPGCGDKLNGWTNDLNILSKPEPIAECETKLVNVSLKAQPQPQGYSPPPRHSPPLQGAISQWIAIRREEIVSQMTEACLNQSLDALLSHSMLMKEDYELVINQPTRTAKVRRLLDTCDKHNEDFSRIVVRKLHDNKQMSLQPYPPEISSPMVAPSAPSLSMSCNIPRKM
ncbi:receptor-interacting serine/threonine-protein kinase 2-like [Neolamprologus brichardi]|uniref:receptor-interacting serine/threonine-protein kinase 2-like n=1 Tax=Neolamprologus brichardi TaxID=32507 RepID=UPI0003EC4721|nr:receptor-interacting serine/threonine-protein kinase 2-like [Neolamprologus brichardi]